MTMNGTQQTTPRENLARTDPAKFWGTLSLDLVVFLASAYFIRYLFIQTDYWINYIALGVFGLVIAASIISAVLVIRKRQETAAYILFYSLLTIGIMASLLYTGRVAVASLSILFTGAIATLVLFPITSRRNLFIINLAAFLLQWVVEWINPPWRISPSAGQIGPGAAALFGILLVIIVVREAWGGNIRVKLITVFTVIALISVGILGSVTYINYRNQVRADIRQRLLNIISVTALQQNGDLHASVRTATDMQSEAYQQLQETNRAILATDRDLAYIFTVRVAEDGTLFFVMDSGLEEGYDPVATGVVYDDPSELLAANALTLDQAIVEQDFYTDQFGTFLSAYAPIYRSDGTREGIVGIDIFADKVLQAEREVLNLILATTIVTLILVTLIGFWLGNLFVIPIQKLSQTAQSIIEGNFSARAEASSTDEIGILANTFNAMTSRLQETLQSLEQRVEERTAELAQTTEQVTRQSEELQNANLRTERRAAQFQAISEISRATAAIQTLDILLPRITELISQQFSFYHTGIFLADEANDYAILVAANSEGGQRMLRRGHRLKIGEKGIVGAVVGSGTPRIALDTGADAVFFENPDLPDTRSEMALPLRGGDLIIGALDVQSTEANAFSEEDVEVLTTLADQVSIAIQNARQYEATQKALAEAEAIYRQYLRNEWTRLTQRQEVPGFTYSLLGTRQISSSYATEEAQQALERGEMQILSTENASALALPIKLRDEIIGVLNVRAPAGHNWNENEIDLVRAVAERVAISAENARLFEETTNRAERERIVADITNKIRSTNDPEEMLQTALSELKRALNVSKIQIVPFNSSGNNQS